MRDIELNRVVISELLREKNEESEKPDDSKSAGRSSIAKSWFGTRMATDGKR